MKAALVFRFDYLNRTVVGGFLRAVLDLSLIHI